MFRINEIAVMVMMGLTLFGCSKQPAATQSAVERGKYLVALGGCNDCHTPKIPGPGAEPILDTSRLLSGHPDNGPVPSWSPEDSERKGVMVATNASFTAWAGPWGVSFAANPTPDKETGIAEWTKETFIRVMRTGKHQGQPNGRDILPPMPWFNLKDLSEEDLKAIWDYLRSLPPIKNQVPFPIPPKVVASADDPK